eukprot:Lithocolla_globosa_v1_NODE_8062_length_866_cov_859.257707.p2 type:complete len:127 gc:universal NODE_8062_length_866_cov_859.257707:733-353(-)
MLGWGVFRMYCLPDGTSAMVNPLGNFAAASSVLTAGVIMQSSPCFQFTGVATENLAVSCRESITRMISSKFLPVEAGYNRDNLSFLSGPIMNTARHVMGRPAASFSSGSTIPHCTANSRFSSAMMG